MATVLVQLERQGGDPGIRDGAVLLRRLSLQRHRPDPCNNVMRKAKVALARKLAVVLHRMLADGKPFAAERAAAAA